MEFACSAEAVRVERIGEKVSERTKMADNSNKMAYHAGEAKGQAQEKASNMMDKVGNAAQSAKESIQETGQQMKAKAQGAADAVKNATGTNK